MANAAAKSTLTAQPRKPRAPRAKAPVDIEQVNAEALKKLAALGLEEQLQRDMEWCLGSYRADRNPVGLYQTAEKALNVFRTEKEKKTKGVTARLINDLEKAVKQQAG